MATTPIGTIPLDLDGETGALCVELVCDPLGRESLLLGHYEADENGEVDADDVPTQAVCIGLDQIGALVRLLHLAQLDTMTAAELRALLQ